MSSSFKYAVGTRLKPKPEYKRRYPWLSIEIHEYAWDSYRFLTEEYNGLHIWTAMHRTAVEEFFEPLDVYEAL